ncbi:uracil-DNA glycosylase family protein [Tropicimonas sp. IMCC6043]|uniref:uracil-DNA glycosylase family protein n=1 Tax=Tropicimonas sp. IMCC6043 TaxID=2510645 RepID=UPI00101D69DB|nr:hypothetical protein EU800_18800 [Tropicimonas sp. IMCC6043]
MCRITEEFRPGDAFPSVVFIGACPGQEEHRQARPFAGDSGVNLDEMLEWMAANHRDIFPSTRRDDYTLLNAWPRALWKARDGRYLPKLSWVDRPDNVERLNNQLAAVQASIVVGLGRPIANARLEQIQYDQPATRAIRRLIVRYRNARYFIVGHPSPRNRDLRDRGNGDMGRWAERTFAAFPGQN